MEKELQQISLGIGGVAVPRSPQASARKKAKNLTRKVLPGGLEADDDPNPIQGQANDETGDERLSARSQLRARGSASDRRLTVLPTVLPLSPRSAGKAEAARAAVGIEMAAPDLAELWRAFHEFDFNGDGTVEVGEVRKFMRSEGRGSEADAMIAELDRDGNGTVSFAEYLQMLSTPGQYTFSSSDDDDDGGGGGDGGDDGGDGGDTGDGENGGIDNHGDDRKAAEPEKQTTKNSSLRIAVPPSAASADDSKRPPNASAPARRSEPARNGSFTQAPTQGLLRVHSDGEEDAPGREAPLREGLEQLLDHRDEQRRSEYAVDVAEWCLCQLPITQTHLGARHPTNPSPPFGPRTYAGVVSKASQPPDSGRPADPTCAS